MLKNIEQKSVLSYIIILFVPIIGLASGVGLSVATGLNGQPAGNLITNAVFLTAVLSLVPIFRFTQQEMGLKLNRSMFGFHIISTLGIFTSYMLFYIFVIRISSLKPIDTTMIASLLNYLIVVVAEEVYFRGQVYRFIEKRFSAPAALIVSSLLFGIFHARQGLSGIITKTITGGLWGSVRYTTGMIYLLIFPVHFVFNATWLLFEGSWNNPPGWAVYAFSAGEVLLTVLIMCVNQYRRSST